MFDRLEPEFGSVVVQRRPGAATVSTAWWLRYRQASPSAHLDVSGRGPAVKPQGLDCRRHAAAGAKPCVRMGAPLSPPLVDLAIQSISRMKIDELTAFILGICEWNNSLCMDEPSDRRRLARAIA